ncbi:MAG: hypothetical protein KDI30_11225 [Pseudomonadales bacterium]|nr:hypothetical protein [Pseudomonadales bacterium]
MSQNLLLCYGMIKDQLSTENRVFSDKNPFDFRIITPFIRDEFREEVIPALLKTGNEQLHTLQTTLLPIARQLIFELNSSIFLRLLEAATNLDNLLPDPYLTEGGFLQELGTRPTVHFPVNKLHRKLRLDIAISTQTQPCLFAISGVEEPLALNNGDCLLSRCIPGTPFGACVPVETENTRCLTLYYYQNPPEPQNHE